MSIGITKRITVEWQLDNPRTEGTDTFTSPLEAATSELFNWMLRNNRVPNNLLINACRYFLHEGTDELVAKVGELREWLREEVAES